MEADQLIVGGLAGLIGYSAGKSAGVTEGQAAIPADLQEVMSNLSIATQQNDLYKAQIVALQSLRAIDQATGQAAQLARQSLESQVSNLTDQLGALSSTLFTGFPIVLGKGDPTLAGWIKGRDNLLISRPLANFIPTGTIIGTTTNDNYHVEGSELSVANILASVPGRPIQVGRNVNTELHITLPRGCDMNVAVILSFDEDVADDMDFLANGVINSLWSGIYCQVTPIGRKSLMIYALAPCSSYSTIGYNNMVCVLKNGHYEATPSAYVAANKWSASATNYKSRFILTHRSAKALTLRSYSIVANPLWAENDTLCYELGISAAEIAKLRPTVDSAQLQRLTTSINPRFLRINDTYNLVVQDVSAAQYVAA